MSFSIFRGRGGGERGGTSLSCSAEEKRGMRQSVRGLRQLFATIKNAVPFLLQGGGGEVFIISGSQGGKKGAVLRIGPFPAFSPKLLTGEKRERADLFSFASGRRGLRHGVSERLLNSISGEEKEKGRGIRGSRDIEQKGEGKRVPRRWMQVPFSLTTEKRGKRKDRLNRRDGGEKQETVAILDGKKRGRGRVGLLREVGKGGKKQMFLNAKKSCTVIYRLTARREERRKGKGGTAPFLTLEADLASFIRAGGGEKKKGILKSFFSKEGWGGRFKRTE